MKNLLFLFAGCTLFCSARGQSQSDYELTIKRIGRFYNLKMADSIVAMYSSRALDKDIAIWRLHDLEELKLRNGKMTGYDYAGQENGVALFKTWYARSVRVTGLLLDKDNKVLVFSFSMRSPMADSILDADKRER